MSLKSSTLKRKMNPRENSREVVETALHEGFIEGVLRIEGRMTREALRNLVLSFAGTSQTGFKNAMRDLVKNKVIWKVGNEYEMRTETAVL